MGKQYINTINSGLDEFLLKTQSSPNSLTRMEFGDYGGSNTARLDDYLFPGRSDGHISEDSAARILRTAFKEVGIIGVSTHSFRRTALTQMSNAGIPLIGI